MTVRDLIAQLAELDSSLPIRIEITEPYDDDAEILTESYFGAFVEADQDGLGKIVTLRQSIGEEVQLTICSRCEHFIEDNYTPHEVAAFTATTKTERLSDGSTIEIARFIHSDDGEKEHDHDPEAGTTMSVKQWKANRPDLFARYADGKIGPNSSHFKR